MIESRPAKTARILRQSEVIGETAAAHHGAVHEGTRVGCQLTTCNVGNDSDLSVSLGLLETDDDQRENVANRLLEERLNSTSEPIVQCLAHRQQKRLFYRLLTRRKYSGVISVNHWGSQSLPLPSPHFPFHPLP